MARRTENPFLSGNFAPVADETTITGLRVEGTVPPYLAGHYLRIGPNPIGNAPEPYDWALGDGMVHAIALYAGRAVTYRNRWVKTEAASTRLGTEPVPGPRRGGADTSNTNVIAFGGRILSLGDDSLPYELTIGLDTIRRVDLAGGARSIGARPKTDPVTGELHVLASTDGPPQLHQVVSAPARPTSRRTLSPPGALRIRDLAVTHRHIAFFGRGIVGLAARDGDGPVRWIETGTDQDVVPITAHDDDEAACVHLAAPALERWTLDRKKGVVHQEVIDEAAHSSGCSRTPRVGARPRHLYTVAGGSMPSSGTTIHKHDLLAGTRQTRDFGPARHPGEFLFVVDPERHDHDDGGWLVGLVHDDVSDRDALLVLDAEDLDRPAAATVHVPRRIPYGLHGLWIPAT